MHTDRELAQRLQSHAGDWLKAYLVPASARLCSVELSPLEDEPEVAQCVIEFSTGHTVWFRVQLEDQEFTQEVRDEIEAGNAALFAIELARRASARR